MKVVKLVALVFVAWCVALAVIGFRDNKNQGTVRSGLADEVLYLPNGLSIHRGDSVYDVSPEMMPYFSFYEEIAGGGQTPAGDYYYEVGNHVYCLRIRYREKAISSREEYCVSAIDEVVSDAEYQLRKRRARQEISQIGSESENRQARSVADHRTAVDFHPFSKQIRSQSDFEQSEFCQTYQCVAESQWPVHNNGDVNHAYHTSVRELGVDTEINPSRNSSVTGIGLTFFDRDQLSTEDFAVIAILVRSACRVSHSDKIMAFIKKNVERNVDQIKLANSIDDCDFRIWAGKVMQQTIEFERTSSDVRH